MRSQPHTFNLTDHFISTCRSGTSQIDLYDEKVAGFCVRISTKRARTFFLIYRGVDGRNKRLKLGRADKGVKADTARKAAKAKLAAIAAGADPASERKVTAATFAGLAEKYLAEHSRKHKVTWLQDERVLGRYVPQEWQQRRLSSFTRDDIEQLHTTVGKDNGEVAANRLLALLHHMWKMARSWSLVQGGNPCADIKRFHEDQRQRFLRPDELQRMNAALLAERDWRWREFFPLSVMLGLRRGELLSLPWSGVDLENGILTLDKTKNGREHVLPLPTPVIDRLSGLSSRGVSPWVFPGGRMGRLKLERHLSAPAGAWGRIKKRADLTGITIHTMRHTLASWMVGQGTSLKIIGAALNHRSSKTTDRYAHVAIEPVRAAMEQTAALMIACAQPQATIGVEPATMRRGPAASFDEAPNAVTEG
jgi:integrase